MSYGFSSLAGPPSSDPLVRPLKCRFGIELAIGPVNDRCWSIASVRGNSNLVAFGKVEMWRSGCRLNISVSASFVWRCLSGSALTPFPHPAHRTGHADFPHPALGQDFTPSPTARRAQARLYADVPAKINLRGVHYTASGFVLTHQRRFSLPTPMEYPPITPGSDG